MSVILDSSELVRHLKKGSPIEVEGETIRLPRFTEVREEYPGDFGIKGASEVVIAKARTHTWCLWPLDRKSKFGEKDGQRFLDLIAAFQEELPQKPVKGWVLTNAGIEDSAKKLVEDAGHQVCKIVG